ncbi:lantibiotic dehydratase [Streptomyces anthocyanicus]|uniref:lantibiotic dehydratase n=1 Tax=Streptomyces anthocyanicus TaxID=68174 RepID=UPI003863B3A0
MASMPRTYSDGRPLGDSPAHIRQAAADPLLREALHIASGSLADSLDRLDAGFDLEAKRRRRTALALSRYVLRVESRATPFGLFAGVASARVGDTTQVKLAGPGTKTVRLDAAWLTRRVTEWLRAPEVRRGVDVVLNDLCRIRGDRLVAPREGAEVSTRNTALVRWVCEKTDRPIGYAGLLELASVPFPHLETEQVDAVLSQLIEHGFLLTSITPQDLDTGLYERLTSAVSCLPGAQEELDSLHRAVNAYATIKPGAGRSAWRGLMRLTDPEGTEARPPVHVDLRVDADLQLSSKVTDEAARYGSAMWELSGDWQTHVHMRTYQDRFLEAYGTTGVVPLGELVDPNRGIGFPPGYSEGNTRDGTPRLLPEELPRQRRVLTYDLVQEALLSSDAQVRLTPALIDQLAGDQPAAKVVPPPKSLELCFQLLAESQTAIDRGDFELLSPPYAGSWLAGATVGRFAELLGVEAELRDLLSGLGDEGTLPAQVVYRPKTLRGLNMAQVPQLLPYRIPVGVFADRNTPGTLDWRQLLVTAGPTGLRLVLPDDGREILPVVPHMLALDREAPPVARLLVELVSGKAKTWTGWNWCGLEGLPYLPRVTFGRVTVSPRRWVPDRHLRQAAVRAPDWDEAVATWRERYSVPDEVNLARWDRMYRVDLTDPWRREVFRQEVRGGGSLAILEDRTDRGGRLGWSHGRSAEVVVPLVRSTASGLYHQSGRSSRTSVAKLWPTDHTVQYLPGEDWLYAKFYGDQATQDDFLLAALPSLVREVAGYLSRWHFIRYRDPEPHIRLRLRGDGDTLRTTVMPRLAAMSRRWQQAGLIRSMTLDTYKPEMDRYGGPEALADAERMFCVDSQSALAQLGMRARGALSLPAPVLAAVNHALLLESLGDWNWSAWISRVLSKGPAHAEYGTYRRHATSLIAPGHTAQSASPALGAPLAALWGNNPETRQYGARLLSDGGRRVPAAEQHAEAVMSLLHMQHNRLLGIDRISEEAALAVLRGVAHDHEARRAHTHDREETG